VAWCRRLGYAPVFMIQARAHNPPDAVSFARGTTVYVVMLAGCLKATATLRASGRSPTRLAAGHPCALARGTAGPAPRRWRTGLCRRQPPRLTQNRIRLKNSEPRFLGPSPPLKSCALSVSAQAARSIPFVTPSSSNLHAGHLVNHRPGPPTTVPPGSAQRAPIVRTEFTFRCRSDKVGLHHKGWLP